MQIAEATHHTATPAINQITEESLRSVKQAADRLGKHKITIYQWAYSGKIKTVMLGRNRMVPESEIMRICREGVPR